MLAEYTEQGQLIRQYDYFQESWSTDPIYQYSKAENADGTTAANYTYSFYHSDHLGTPQLLMESNGAVSWRAAYEAFGEAKELAIAQGSVTKENLLRFPGQYYDGEMGTHYNFHRDYDFGLGRYVTSDPIGLAGGRNRYEYALSNSLIYLDYNGLEVFGYWIQPPRVKNINVSLLSIQVNSSLFSDETNILGSVDILAEGMVTYEIGCEDTDACGPTKKWTLSGSNDFSKSFNIPIPDVPVSNRPCFTIKNLHFKKICKLMFAKNTADAIREKYEKLGPEIKRIAAAYGDTAVLAVKAAVDPTTYCKMSGGAASN